MDFDHSSEASIPDLTASFGSTFLERILATFRFYTAENELAKKIVNICKKLVILLTSFLQVMHRRLRPPELKFCLSIASLHLSLAASELTARGQTANMFPRRLGKAPGSRCKGATVVTRREKHAR